MRHAALLAAIAATLVAGCGGDGESAESRDALRWQATPRVLRSADARLLQGVVRNESRRSLELSAEDLVPRTRAGRRLAASVAFLTGYVRPGEPQNRGPTVLSEQERARTGRAVRLEPDATAPLTVAWRSRDGQATRIEYPGGELPVPGDR